MSIDYSYFLLRLREERIRNQKTQSDMGSLLHIPQSHYSKAESGARGFTLYELQNLCKTPLNIYYIFTGRHPAEYNEDTFERVGFEQLLCCVKIIHLIARCKCKTNTEKDGWHAAYLHTKYVESTDTPIAAKKSIFKAVRIYTDYTQIQMANVLGIDIKKLRDLENQRLLPDSELVFYMYQLFGISPALFLKDKRCLQLEIACLLNNAEDKVRKTLQLCIDLLLSNED